VALLSIRTIDRSRKNARDARATTRILKLRRLTGTSLGDRLRHLAVDGATIVVSATGKSTRVRLIGVERPELGGQGKTVAYFARESTAFAGSLLDVRDVFLLALRGIVWVVLRHSWTASL
jgi:endonuclease YncB( thermonuclease family)